MRSAKEIGPAGRQALEASVAEAVAAGGRLAPKAVADREFGATRPATAVLVDRSTAAAVARLVPDFEAGLERTAKRLARVTQNVVRHINRCDRRRQEGEKLEIEVKTASDALADSEHRQAGRHPWLLVVALVMIGLGDVAFADTVLNLFGLTVIVTWTVASVLGLTQLWVTHHAGMRFSRLNRARTGEDHDAGHHSGQAVEADGLVVATIGILAVVVAVMLAWLRADYLATTPSQPAGTAAGALANPALAEAAAHGGGHLNPLVAFGFFLALQLLIDAAAFAVGNHGGTPAVRRLARARGAQFLAGVAFSVADWRRSRAMARFGAVFVEAVSWCNLCLALIEKIAAFGRAGTASLYVEQIAATDPLTAAVLSEPAQLDGFDMEAAGRITQATATVQERRRELRALAASVGYPVEAVDKSHADNEPAGEAPGQADAEPGASVVAIHGSDRDDASGGPGAVGDRA